MDHIDQNDHIVDHIDQHDELKPKLLAIVPPIAMNGHDVCVPISEQDAVRSSHSHDSSVKDEAWISDVATVLERCEIDTNGVITWVVLIHSVWTKNMLNLMIRLIFYKRAREHMQKASLAIFRNIQTIHL